MSFAYEIFGTEHTPNRPGFGNAVIEIEFEPKEDAHVRHLEQLIGAELNIDHPKVLGWQRLVR